MIHDFHSKQQPDYYSNQDSTRLREMIFQSKHRTDYYSNQNSTRLCENIFQSKQQLDDFMEFFLYDMNFEKTHSNLIVAIIIFGIVDVEDEIKFRTDQFK